MREKAVGATVIKSVRPDQQVIKIVNDGLTEMLGGEAEALRVDVTPPAVILMTGLQGSGKTTTSGKLALHLRKTAQESHVGLSGYDQTSGA